MFDALNSLWTLMTLFFSVEVIYVPLFMSFLLMPVVFYVLYFLISLLDFDSWRR